MPIRYKINVMAALKEAGYSAYKLGTVDKSLTEYTMQQIRKGEIVSPKNLERICAMLKCQPGDLLEYIE